MNSSCSTPEGELSRRRKHEPTISRTSRCSCSASEQAASVRLTAQMCPYSDSDRPDCSVNNCASSRLARIPGGMEGDANGLCVAIERNDDNSGSTSNAVAELAKSLILSCNWYCLGGLSISKLRTKPAKKSQYSTQVYAAQGLMIFIDCLVFVPVRRK